MNNQNNFNEQSSEKQFEYQEIHPEFKTDMSDIKWNGRESIKDVPFWELILGMLAIVGIILFGIMIFFLFASGAIFYAIPYIVLGGLVIRVMYAILLPKENIKK